MVFKDFKGKIIDISPYIVDFVQRHPETEIYISTDSQSQGSFSIYVSVVVLYIPQKGGHVVYSRNFETRKIFGKASGKDFNKLFLESQMSLNLANKIFEDTQIRVNWIELDYNPDPKYFSNSVLTQTLGWITSCGYCVKYKPNVCSTYMADKLVKKSNRKHV
jgi:predicted RNase H-related nuclease YkuK (DUF458 family)